MDLKRTLKLAKHRRWRDFLTGDESWFHLIIDHEQIWTRAEVAPPIIPRKMISSSKWMVTIFWSPLGFRVIRVLPKGAHFDATYFRDNILNDIDYTRPPVVKKTTDENWSCILIIQDQTRQGASLLIVVKKNEKGSSPSVFTRSGFF
jgi:hypothetical protein